MPIATASPTHICSRCLRAGARPTPAFPRIARRYVVNSPPSTSTTTRHGARKLDKSDGEGEGGALSHRLAQMTEESLETGGRSARKAVEEAGFDKQLLQQLEERIASANFKNEHASALAEANLPASAGRGTRDIAGAQPWAGTETVEDAALRMLTDAHKPLRGSAKILPPRGPPRRIDTGRSKSKASSGTRLANARDRSSSYAAMKDSSISEDERNQFRKEMKARFDPDARSAPATLQGLASLANERIEDAIARGQFKNIPRGMPIERDYNASSPFINTTEYLMNKMIQKQDIVPPWIEKQQEIVSMANKFRSRLRNDWRRHAARSIASMGGSLREQVKRAEEYASAEEALNPPKRKEEKVHTVGEGGQMSQITLAGELKVTGFSGSSSSIPVKGSMPESHITITETPVSPDATPISTEPATEVKITTSPAPPDVLTTQSLPPQYSFPFRDPHWEKTELAYHTASIDALNALNRTYNLIAPQLAQKPYFALSRELTACFAEVAPQVAGEIIARSKAGRVKVEVVGHRPGGVLERFAGDKAKVHDERVTKQYGLKQFWRDLWRNEGV